jgi:hypothetical protein
MSRTFRPFVLLLGLLALPALAAESLAEGANCPARKAAEAGETEVEADSERSPGSSTSSAPRASGGEAAAGNQRVRPRWQSFLPGMIR